jgi:hypothetical protein
MPALRCGCPQRNVQSDSAAPSCGNEPGPAAPRSDVSNVSTVSIELQGKLLPFQHMPWDAWPLWARGLFRRLHPTISGCAAFSVQMRGLGMLSGPGGATSAAAAQMGLESNVVWCNTSHRAAARLALAELCEEEDLTEDSVTADDDDALGALTVCADATGALIDVEALARDAWETAEALGPWDDNAQSGPAGWAMPVPSEPECEAPTQEAHDVASGSAALCDLGSLDWVLENPLNALWVTLFAWHPRFSKWPSVLLSYCKLQSGATKYRKTTRFLSSLHSAKTYLPPCSPSAPCAMVRREAARGVTTR